MAPIDIVVLAVIGIAFVAVCVRIYRKGTCADCAHIAPTKRPAPHLRAWTKSPKTWAAVSNKVNGDVSVSPFDECRAICDLSGAAQLLLR